MSRNNSSLKELLQRLQKTAGLAPPTPAEADAAMAGPEESDIDDQRLIDIADAVVRDQPIGLKQSSPVPWCEDDHLTEVEREQFVLNRNGGELDEEMKARIEEAERKALSDDEDSDDEDAVERGGDAG